MEKALSFTFEPKKRSELFRSFVGRLVQESGSETSYSTCLRSAVLSLAQVMGRHIGLKNGPEFAPFVEPPTQLLQLCSPNDLPDLYQESLSSRPVFSGANLSWIEDRGARRSAGAYYTPSQFVRSILEFVNPSEEPISICDPACGSGAFLLGALQRWKSNDASGALSHIFGCDSDPIAIDICRALIWLETGQSIPDENLICAESLSLDWSKAFGGRRFRAVVGNPPFGSVVSGRVPDATKKLRNTMYRDVGGTADLSYYFASLAIKIVEEDGRIGLVVPSAFLSASSARNIRENRTLDLSVIERCKAHDHFEGAAVHVSLVGFTKSADKATAHISQSTEANSDFKVSASMTVGEAYDLAPHILDDHTSTNPKLLTTGLIDPETSRWGEMTCRYLKSKYTHPRVPFHLLSNTRKSMAIRPKLLVAGLSRTIECYLDEHAEYAGSVGTYTVTHANDDRGELRRMMNILHSPQLRKRFQEELGPSALGGGSITLTKRFLRQYLEEETS